MASIDFEWFQVRKIRFFTSRPGDLKWCGLYLLHGGQPNLQIRAQYDDFRQQKSDFSQLLPETSNGAFSLSYDESSLTCKFKLHKKILDLDRYQLSKNPIFHNLSRRPQIVRFVLVTLRAA